MTPALIVHGGAGPTPPGDLAPYRAGCRAALLAGWELLRAGGSAMDAVEGAIRVLEDDPHFNAGRGAVLNADGEGELDASIMDGEGPRAGAGGGGGGGQRGETVGAVALDLGGHIAAGTSTGGTAGKRPGRVGDSALIGCGTYADSRVGGASATGLGEAIIRVVLARFAVEQIRDGGDPQGAARRGV